MVGFILEISSDALPYRGVRTMIDISVIILVGREKLHIRRCLEKLRQLEPRQVFVVESQPSDGTHEIAVEMGATTVFNRWPGNQAAQFNWALDNLPIKASWVLRLDADEYLYPDAIEEIMELLPKWDGRKNMDGRLPPDVTSLSLARERRYLQMDLKFGGKEVELIRIFKFGFGRSANSEMDEYIVTSGGRNLKLNGKFVDDSLMSFADWQEKHRGYAKREARMAVHGCANKNKAMYYKLPPYFRAFAYFCIRYFLKLGFLDGKAGWKWNFWQGLWYRCLVDKEISKLRKEMRLNKKQGEIDHV